MLFNLYIVEEILNCDYFTKCFRQPEENMTVLSTLMHFKYQF